MRNTLVLVLLIGSVLSPSRAVAQQLFFTDTWNDQVWVANKDGSGSPVLLHPNATGGYVGPVAILVVNPISGVVVYTGGNYPEIWSAPADGTSAPSLLWSDSGNEHLGVTINPSTGMLYWTVRTPYEIRSAAYDGTGGISTVFSFSLADGTPLGITYDESRDRLCWTTSSNSEVRCGNADGSGSPTTLFSTNFDQPRQIVYDPVSDRLYWTGHEGPGSGYGGHIFGANADGTGYYEEIYDSGGADTYPYGIDVDPETGLLYWTLVNNDGDDSIMVAPADGSGTPTVLFSGPFGRLRGIAAGVNIVWDIAFFADGFETADTLRWSATVGGT